jgi:uncharacterized protein (DUF1501 family)
MSPTPPSTFAEDATMHLTRRKIIQGAALGALTSLLPGHLRAMEGLLSNVRTDRILILVELEGGNDGLNTLVPFNDNTYKTKRDKLRLVPDSTDDAKRVIPFSTWSGSASLPGVQDGFGVHALLNPLQSAWKEGDLAFIHGIGYTQPNLSHFRGIEIWSYGTDDTQPLIATGWLGRMMAAQTMAPSHVNTASVIFNRENDNPARTPAISTISMARPADFIEGSTNEKMPLPSKQQFDAAQSKPTLLHLLNTQRAAHEAHGEFQAAVGTPPVFTTEFPKNAVGTQAKYIAQCIAGGLPCSFYKMSVGSFDTHAGQLGRHAYLLDRLAQSLKALRDGLIEKGRWDNVLIMTYSEFGRRIEENGSEGTDHGTAAPHFMLGGKVKGGVYGTQPVLAAADERGNLVANTDFRRLYATCGSWLGISESNIAASLDPFAKGLAYAPIPCVAWS